MKVGTSVLTVVYDDLGFISLSGSWKLGAVDDGVRNWLLRSGENM